MATHSVSLPGESQGQRSLVGCRLWGRTESDTTEVTQQQHGVRKCSSFILLQVVDQFSQHHLLKRLSFLHCIFLGGSFNKERNSHTRLAVFGSCKMSRSPFLLALHRSPNGVQSHTHSSVQRCLSHNCDQLIVTPPGSSVHGILQARILEWVAICSETISGDLNPGTEPRDRTLISCVSCIARQILYPLSHQGSPVHSR